MNVVSLLCPRRDHKHWTDDYFECVKALDWSCQRLGLRHIVMTDDPALPVDCETFVNTDAPESLMKATNWFYWKWCDQGNWAGGDTLFTGVDCLIVRDPQETFDSVAGDMIMTARLNYPKRPINTGCTIVRRLARGRASIFWRNVFEATGDEWGDDLTAIAKTIPAAPTKFGEHGLPPYGMTVHYADLEQHNDKPRWSDETKYPTVAHFKGQVGKKLMLPWAAKRLGYPGFDLDAWQSTVATIGTAADRR